VTDVAVFIDRDGTMAPDVHYCRRPEDFELFPNTAKAIRLLNEHGFKVRVITNQSGIARGYFTEDTLARIHDKMITELAKEGARVDLWSDLVPSRAPSNVMAMLCINP